MTVSTETAAITHTGNGVLTEFNIPFKFLSEDHIQVTKITVATGAAVILTPAEYTITGEGSETGGTLTVTPAIASTHQLYVERRLPLTQDLDLERQGGFFPEDVETQLDKIVMMIQMIMAELEAATGGEITSITRNVAGPASSVVGNLAVFDNTTGTVIEDSGIALADLATADHVHESDWTELIKAADWTRASTTTLANDADLQFAMAANTTYLIEARLFLNSLTTSGFKIGISGPASPTLIQCTGTDIDSAGNLASFGISSYTTVRANTPAGNEDIVLSIAMRIANGSNTGTFAIQFAQNVSNGAAATLRSGSYMRYKTV
jgi:hypothetical protein